MSENLEDRIKKIIVDQLNVNEEQVTPEASFVDDLKADSLDIVELVMALEDDFDIKIPDEDYDKIATVVFCLQQGAVGAPQKGLWSVPSLDPSDPETRSNTLAVQR